ncbi:MAG: AraC family transcriptional regulator [Fusicatenibacter sp.]|nr:AraC family transcriptional regulator [Fusicatenibacter sp.]
MTDVYCWGEQRKILTAAESGIEALVVFGMQNSTRAGEPLPPHMHPGCLEIVFLTKGFQCYEAEGQLFALTGNDLFVSYPDEVHSSGSYPEAISDIIWFQIDLESSGAFFGLDTFQADFMKKRLRKLPRIFRGDRVLQNDLTKAFFYLAATDSLTRMMGQYTFLCCLCRILMLSEHLTQSEPEEIAEAIAYIHEHLGEQIRLEELAQSCHLSLSRFKSKFKEKTGTTPRAFINCLKVEQAKLLLKQRTSVTQTASLLGFDTPNYFASIFKKYTGMTPSQYVQMKGEV